MVSTTTRIGEEEATHREVMAANTYGDPHTVAGKAMLQVTAGAAGTTVTIQRHPMEANNRNDPPAGASAHWVNAAVPGVVDASVGALIAFEEPGVAWYRYKASAICTTFLSAREE
jgi:hypothetical protein